MTIRITENEGLLSKRQTLWQELENPVTSNDRKRTIAAEIMAYDDLITRNLEKRLQHLRTECTTATNHATPMSRTKRYELLKRIGREAQSLVVEVREEKKFMRERR